MLDGLTGRALLEAIGAMAANPHPQDKRALQRPPRPERAEYLTPFPILRRRTPCRHCRPSSPCLKHAKY